MQTPLIWTTKGNMPVSDLVYKTNWIDNEDETIFQEIYEHDGEVVRSSAHVYKKKGSEMGAEQVNFG